MARPEIPGTMSLDEVIERLEDVADQLDDTDLDKWAVVAALFMLVEFRMAVTSMLASLN